MSNQKTVVITGAAMGMGALKARKLAERGWKVFAGVLEGADTSELGDHANIIKVEQDVSSDASVKASAKTVEEHLAGAPLDLLINNAGIANTAQGVVEGFSIEEAKRLFEINTWGTLRVVQAFLPAVRRGAPSSRIINFASGAVKANPVGSGAYNMSKHAVVGLTRTLRHELAPFGIQVTAVEPGAVKTHMTANSRESTKVIWSKVSDEMNEVYGPHHKHTTTEVLPEAIEKGNPPEVVVDQVLGLLDKAKWKPSYLVGKDVAMMGPLFKLLPENTFEGIIQSANKTPQYKAS
ncbi:MAG: SDR family NAD(P)-dependent oxidoreductase [Pseudomonadota bacterium]